MKIIETPLDGVLILEPAVLSDSRGFFLESWNEQLFAKAVGTDVRFVQDNHSFSRRNVLRGIHYQIGRPQGKLVRVVSGTVFDVAVDLRRSAPGFGRWFGVELSGENRRQLWIPPGFGHAFLVLSEDAHFLYKTTEYWLRDGDRSLRWNDPALGIGWPLGDGEPLLSDRDRDAPLLAQAECFP